MSIESTHIKNLEAANVRLTAEVWAGEIDLEAAQANLEVAGAKTVIEKARADTEDAKRTLLQHSMIKHYGIQTTTNYKKETDLQATLTSSQARIKELEAVADLNLRSRGETVLKWDKAEKHVQRVAKDNARLREALEKYGRHIGNCPQWRGGTGHCICGLTQALQQQECTCGGSGEVHICRTCPSGQDADCSICFIDGKKTKPCPDCSDKESG